VRKSQGMVPTARAEHLARPVRTALGQLRQSFEAPYVFDPRVSAKSFRIALSDDIELRLVRLLGRTMLSGDLQMQTRAVAGSDLIACIQESVVKRFGPGLGLVSCAEPLGLPSFTLRMVWDSQREHDPAHIWLRNLLVKELRGRGRAVASEPLGGRRSKRTAASARAAG
jgi:DNA-binding transcriptional LysR family regulator